MQSSDTPLRQAKSKGWQWVTQEPETLMSVMRLWYCCLHVMHFLTGTTGGGGPWSSSLAPGAGISTLRHLATKLLTRVLMAPEPRVRSVRLLCSHQIYFIATFPLN